MIDGLIMICVAISTGIGCTCETSGCETSGNVQCSNANDKFSNIGNVHKSLNNNDAKKTLSCHFIPCCLALVCV